MSIITVCIPAFDAKEFLGETLESVQNQSFKDFCVKISLEPTENSNETVRIIEKYLTDKRFSLAINSTVLGWAANIDHLLKQVNTPYFIILPHDDIIHPDYLSLLHHGISQDDEIAVCFGDMQFFGGHGGQKFREFNNENLFSRLASFYLLGAEAVPWRGVTCSKILDAGYSFPTNKWNSLWVECEWAQLLLKYGKAIRVPKSIYFKRIFPVGKTSVSRNWFVQFNELEKKSASDYHREVMLSGFNAEPEIDHHDLQILKFCHSVAMVRRVFLFLPNQSKVLIEEVVQLNEELKPLTFPLKNKILSRSYLLLSKLMGHEGELEKSLSYAHQAIEYDLLNAEAHCRLAELLLHNNHPESAITWINEARKFALNTPWIEALTERFQQQMQSKKT